MEWIFTLEDIDRAGDEIVRYLSARKERVIALYGPMGAGKTTLSAALIRKLGSMDIVSSPTFSIINEYLDSNGKPIYHMDWYRLRDEEEALNVGVEDPLYSGHWCLVEWPEKAENLLPHGVIKIQIDALDEKTRKVSLRG
jgi:tRNA threonylcarbamoyladenosine biosynthesis protein TsaE